LEYTLHGIQTLLRPKGYGYTLIDSGAMPATSTVGCDYSSERVGAAISKVAAKYSIPESLLWVIYEIEGTEHIANPTGYICSENPKQAAGIMQITRGTYNVVTCPDERMANDIGVCTPEGSKQLSRCDIDDAVELAARVLLWKAGKWVYGGYNCSATGGISTKMDIYNASCNYYGSFSPDTLTVNYSQSIPADSRRTNGPMNYCDIVCYKTGLCPPYP